MTVTSMTAWMLSPETFVGLYLLITLIMIYDYNSGLLIPDNNLADRFIHNWYIIVKGLPKIKLRLTGQKFIAPVKCSRGTQVRFAPVKHEKRFNRASSISMKYLTLNHLPKLQGRRGKS